jgi:hypothetical protein
MISYRHRTPPFSSSLCSQLPIAVAPPFIGVLTTKKLLEAMELSKKKVKRWQMLSICIAWSKKSSESSDEEERKMKKKCSKMPNRTEGRARPPVT